MTDNKDALDYAESISRMDTFTDYQRSEILKAAAHLRRLVAEVEAKDALLSEAVEHILASSYGKKADDIITRIRAALGEQEACEHKWTVLQQGQTYMDTKCSKCGKTERNSWD